MLPSDSACNRQLLGVNRASRCELARVKVDCVHADKAEIQIGIGSQEFAERVCRNILATRERDVRVPWAKVRFQTDGERCFLNAFMDLK